MPVSKEGLSLLSRSWIIPVSAASICFLTIQISLICPFLFGNSCGSIAPSYAKWTWYVNLSEASVFCGMIIVQMSKVLLTNVEYGDFGCIVTTCMIGVYAGASSIINLVGDLTGICEDSFGVRMPLVFWGEWITCVPLLYYIVLATFDKNQLSFTENSILMLNFIVFLSALCLQFSTSYYLSIFLLSFAMILEFLGSILFYRTINISEYFSPPKTQCETDASNKYTKCLRATQIKLAILLLIFLPLFPIVYMFSFFRLITHDINYLFFVILNVSSKLVFNSIINNALLNINADVTRLKLLTETIALRAEIAANESRRLFVRYIMHEVRVPLNSITMGIGYLEQHPNLDDDARDALLMMEGATGFMKQTLNDVLNMQRIEEGKFELDYAPFSITNVVNRVIASVQGTLKEKHIRLDINIDSKVPKQVIGDGFRIEHVIINLVNNALKFSPPQSQVSIKVTAEVLFRGSGKANSSIRTTNTTTNNMPKKKKREGYGLPVTFTVTDHGDGISESNINSLFIPFSQIRPHEVQKGEGSGIGLVICKQIVELHGGTISCTSEVGLGSSFSFVIPFQVSQDLNDDVSSSALDMNLNLQNNFLLNPYNKSSINNSNSSHALTSSVQRPLSELDAISEVQGVKKCHSAGSIITYNVNGSIHLTREFTIADDSILKHVLLVDDVLSNRKLLAMLLKGFHIESSMAANGEEGVSMAMSRSPKNSFDLIFMDNLMPVMSGVAATESLRSLGYDKLIIGITGNAMEEEVSEFIRAGADAVILKPVTVKQLKQIIEFTQIHGNMHVPQRKLYFCDNSFSVTELQA